MAFLTDAVKTMLNALAFADAGELLTRTQKARHLEKTGALKIETDQIAVSESQSTGPRQRIALYMGSELPAYVMNYIVQTCGRLNNGLTVLTFQSESAARNLLAAYKDALESAGISMHLVVLSGDPLPGLARYLRRHPEVAFLACKETGYLGRSFLNGAQRTSALPVPVVLVETQRSDAQKTGQSQPKMAVAGGNAA